MSISLRFDVPKLDQELRRAMPRIQKALLAALQTNRGMLFRKEGAHNGHRKWEKLRLRSGQILGRRGALKNSIAPATPGRAGPKGIARVTPKEVQVGTTLAYAAMMNFGTAGMPGGVLRSKSGKMLKIPLPSGKSATPEAKSLSKGAKKIGNQRFIFRAFVRIPARRFDELNQRDLIEMANTYAGAIAAELSR